MNSPTAPAAYALYQRLRPVEPPDSPLAGVLARAPDGRTVLLVDRDLVAEWPGWGAAGEPHLLSPLDVVRRADGHDVALPALTERVEAFLVRRSDAEAPLSPGEAVTLAVSVVRGLSPSIARDGDGRGEWWLADDGRPVLVEGIGASSTRETSAEVCAALAASMPRTRLGAALVDLAAIMTAHDPLDDLLDAEERLFACAEAEPLVTEVLGPLRARRLAVEIAAVETTAVDPAGEAEPRRTLWERLAFHVDADLAATASDALTRVLRSIRRPTASRARPIVWAAGIAAVVVIGGLLWPTGSEEPEPSADAESVVLAATPADATSTQTDAATGAAAPVTDAPPGTDAAAVAADLLDRRTACADSACLSSVVEDPARVFPGGVIDASTEARDVTLLDDLGGLVVVRVDSVNGSHPVQLVTVVETEDGWRIRDVHDVADAPP